MDRPFGDCVRFPPKRQTEEEGKEEKKSKKDPAEPHSSLETRDPLSPLHQLRGQGGGSGCEENLFGAGIGEDQRSGLFPFHPGEGDLVMIESSGRDPEGFEGDHFLGRLAGSTDHSFRGDPNRSFLSLRPDSRPEAEGLE